MTQDYPRDAARPKTRRNLGLRGRDRLLPTRPVLFFLRSDRAWDSSLLPKPPNLLSRRIIKRTMSPAEPSYMPATRSRRIRTGPAVSRDTFGNECVTNPLESASTFAYRCAPSPLSPESRRCGIFSCAASQDAAPAAGSSVYIDTRLT